SCLSDYLVADPPLSRAATEFFDLQAVVTDAAWTLSAGDDAARLDSIHGIDVPADVARQRWTLEQVLQATLVDQSVAEAFTAVTFMLAHPSSLAEPALIERAIAACGRADDAATVALPSLCHRGGPERHRRPPTA